MVSAHGCGPCYGGSIPLILPIEGVAQLVEQTSLMAKGQIAGNEGRPLVQVQPSSLVFPGCSSVWLECLVYRDMA